MMLLIVQLSIPSILAQISTIIMEYIDASMVGHLGAREAASIGLVASSTWLMGGLSHAANIGFTVQIAQNVGGGREMRARNLVKVGLLFGICFSGLITIIAVLLHKRIPEFLGADISLHADASLYFLIIALSLPAMQLNSMAAGMLQCSGNMKLPSALQIFSCFLNIFLNFILIFDSQTFELFGLHLHIKGLGLGVMGAALGTAITEVIIMSLMLYFLLFHSKLLRLRVSEKFCFSVKQIKEAFRISWPVGLEQVIMCSAFIMFTAIVSPLGTESIAANSFAITIESLCYMPGYGIAAAATTIIGQCIGAKRFDLTRKLAFLVTGTGMFVMAVMGLLMYIFAAELIGLFTPNEMIRTLGAHILRIESIAEPFYAAAIVATGVFRGAGSTFVPSLMNLFCMWIVRIPFALFMTARHGLYGAWIAMSSELCLRGIIFIVRLSRKNWMYASKRISHRRK
ncbi:MAG: MATE family efflux transporter [Fibrobacter sp.]|nr:MATE family efflux transporter [Fibrobacter sp.]